MNWYAYAGGNPVMFVDPSGNSYMYYNGGVRIQYTLASGKKNVVLATSAQAVYDTFNGIAQGPDKITQLNITTHGSEDGDIILGSGDDITVLAKGNFAGNPNISIGMRSEMMQAALSDSIDPSATIKCDVCYGGLPNGIGPAIKDAVPGATVTAFPGKVSIPFANFAMPTIRMPWQPSAITVQPRPKGN